MKKYEKYKYIKILKNTRKMQNYNIQILICILQLRISMN